MNDILLDSLEEGNTKPFYSYLKSQKQDSQGVSPLREGGQLYSDAVSKARILSNQFKSVFTRDDPDAPVKKLPGPDYPDIPELIIRPEGVEKLLAGLNPRKASGPDEIPARMLQSLSTELAPALTAIFTQSVEEGALPKQWKTAWIAPVFKKGGRSDPANYRPVSLTSIACKMLEHILCTHIRRHLDTHDILGPENHGFRAKHSTETQLLLTTHDLLKNKDAGKQLDVIILDFSKAFDTVPHRRLLGKLENCGVKGSLLRWIESFLVGRSQSVLVDGSRSREEDVLSGVPQGTVLGPLLFILYINDLPSQVHSSTRCRLFADDCLLYRVIDSTQDQMQLQDDLRNLERWAADWGMVFNPAKCFVMPINRGTSHQPYFYQLCGVILKTVEQEKYLGVIISHDLAWRPHINTVVAKANQKLGFIKRNLKGSPKELKRLACISFVRSGLEYACTVWDPQYKLEEDALEKPQRRAARWIASSYGWRTSVDELLVELNLEPLAERRRISRLLFMYKILNEHVAVPPEQMDILLKTRPIRGSRTSQRLLVPRFYKSNYENSFTPRTVAQWNKLPEVITSAATVSCFRSRLTSHKCP